MALRSVAVLLQEPVALFEFGVLAEVFGIDRTEEGVPAFDYRVCAETPGPARRPQRHDRHRRLRPRGRRRRRPRRRAGLAAAAHPVARPSSRCCATPSTAAPGSCRCAPGAFTLGAAGLLDGRDCTTHWRHAAELAAAPPAGPGRPRRALRARRHGHHQRRHRGRHRRRALPRARRARSARRHDDRPPDGRAAAPRRRPAPVHRPPGAGDAPPRAWARCSSWMLEHLDEACHRRRPRPAGGDVAAHLRPPVRRRDRHDAAPVGHRPAGAARPRSCSRRPTCRSRPSPATPGSGRRRCCATTSPAAPASPPRPSAPSAACPPDVRGPHPVGCGPPVSASGCRGLTSHSGRAARGTPRRRDVARAVDGVHLHVAAALEVPLHGARPRLLRGLGPVGLGLLDVSLRLRTARRPRSCRRP